MPVGREILGYAVIIAPIVIVFIALVLVRRARQRSAARDKVADRIAL